MADDQVIVMLELGFNCFSAIGHDRGARVLHRMCLDHPAAVGKVALLDILPTSYLYSQTNMQFATQYWEWFFFTQKGETSLKQYCPLLLRRFYAMSSATF